MLEGESQLASENVLVEECVIHGLRPGPAGSETVNVTFKINVDGIFTVEVENFQNGAIQQYKINSNKVNFDSEMKTVLAHRA